LRDFGTASGEGYEGKKIGKERADRKVLTAVIEKGGGGGREERW